MSTTETTLLTWERGQIGGLHGKAAGVTLFTISWHTTRSDPDWYMRTTLPGWQRRIWKHDDEDTLKAAAEKALALWIARVSGNAAKEA